MFFKKTGAQKELRSTDLGAKAKKMDRLSGTIRTRTVSSDMLSGGWAVIPKVPENMGLSKDSCVNSRHEV